MVTNDRRQTISIKFHTYFKLIFQEKFVAVQSCVNTRLGDFFGGQGPLLEGSSELQSRYEHPPVKGVEFVEKLLFQGECEKFQSLYYNFHALSYFLPVAYSIFFSFIQLIIEEI